MSDELALRCDGNRRPRRGCANVRAGRRVCVQTRTLGAV